ncbi:MAG: F0F1 ATP synthase subunit B [Ignavibacteriaceae bacterium]
MPLNMILGIIASSEGGGTLLDINPGLIFWTVITFIILLIILKKVAWKPILTALDQREKSIKESLEKAEMAKKEAERILQENKANLAKASEESGKIIEQGRAYAEKLKSQILQEGKEQSRKMIEEAKEEIERQNQAAFEELRKQVADIAIKAAEKIINETLDQEKQRKIVEKYLNEIKRN